MNWLISLLIAGTMISANENSSYFQTKNSFTETKNERVVKADESERFEQTYPLSANGRVAVLNVNGSITVEGWDRNEVKLEYVKTAETKEQLSDVEVKIDAQANSFNVEAKFNNQSRRANGNGRNKGAQVEFRLMVPRGAALNEIETVNGSVNLSNTTNSAKVSTVNGEVKASNISGTAELATVNGTVTADFERLENTNQIRLETVNGQAFLTLPSNADVTVKAETTNGNITNDFGLPVRRGRFVGSSLYGRIGSGTVRVNLESVNGELGLRRKQDGKNLNPVTNLLGSKSDDDDFDGAMDKTVRDSMREAGKVKIDSAKMNAEVQNAMAEAQKEIAKAKIDGTINQAEIQKNIRLAMQQQKIAMENLRDAGWFRGTPTVERKSETFQVKGKPKVTIDAKDYAVFVRGWDREEVQYTITQISGNDSPAAIQAATVDHSDSEVKILMKENNDAPVIDFGNMRLRIEVFVPRKSDLKITTEKEVRLENVSGKLDVQGGAEAIDVRDSDGNLNLTTGGGKVRVIGFQGTVDASGGDGLMSLEGDFQKLSAHTAGTIILTLPENANAIIESNQSEINGEGVNLIRQNTGDEISTWKIGNGGQNYSLDSSDDGKIFVRSAVSLKIN